jgi:membrane protein implicated in regulation of membrane protease activity
VLLVASVLVALLVLPRPWGWLVVPVALVIEAVQLLFGIRLAQRRRAARLVGRTGRVRAAGVVEIRGELWAAAGATETGRQVTVVSVDGRTLVVKER